MTFSIDEVRTSFESDLKSFLDRIDNAGHSLVEVPVQWPGARAFQTIGEQSHAIAGTTSLVGARSMTTSAQLMEELAETGRALVADIELAAARARDLGTLCLEGAAAVRRMSSLELAGRRAEADALAAELATRVAAARASDLATRPPAAAAAAAPLRIPPRVKPQAATGPSDIAPELREIFVEEAREAAATLRELFEIFSRDPSPASAEPIERVFHTLKGAAATVGLQEVFELAKTLQLRLAGAVDGEEAIDRAFVDDIIRDASWWFDLTGLPGTALGPSPGRSARELFVEEAGRVLSGLRIGLADATMTRAAAVSAFHQLKGSAMVVGDAATGDAAKLIERNVNERADWNNIAAAGVAQLQALIEGRSIERPITTRRSGSASGESTARPTRVQLTSAIDAELWQAVNDECRELLESADKELVELERSHHPERHLEALFRHYHTLKGAVNTIGLSPLGLLLHTVESFVESLGGRDVKHITKQIADALHEAQQQIRRGLEQAPRGYLEVDTAKVQRRIDRVLAPASVSEGSMAWQSADGSDLALSVDEQSQVPSVGSVGSMGPDSVSDVLEPQERRYIRVPIERLDSLMNLVGELVVGRLRLDGRTSQLRGIQRGLTGSRRRLLDTVDRFSNQYEFVNLGGGSRRNVATRGGNGHVSMAQPSVTQSSNGKGSNGHGAAHQVGGGGGGVSGFGSIELDTYEDIHILARSLTEVSIDFSEMDAELLRELSAFGEDAERLGGTVSLLQNEITRARMIPVESLFARLRLPIRDAAEREHKDVRVVTTGDDVTLDKAITDALFAPMLHLVRNAVSHGIEFAKIRTARGKEGQGVVTLAARQESGQIALEVTDDGNGLDLEALRAKGAAAGLVPADIPLDDPAVINLVFAPGISTSAVASSTSGRGVGGNVVKRAVDRLNGNIRVTSSGEGTTFTITLPLTLTITRAVLVRCGEAIMAVPLYFAERIREPAKGEVIESAGVRRLLDGDNYIPVHRLSTLLGASTQPGGGGVMVLLRMGGDSMALEVDAVLGQEEIVVKPLGAVLDGHDLFTGVTIRGTGELALILDVPGIIEKIVGTAAPTVSPRAFAAVAPAERPAEQAPAALHAPGAVLARAADPAPAYTYAPAPEPEPVPEPAPAPAPTRISILFIDDSISVRKVAERALNELGYEVTVAIDGADGIAKLREGRFDLVFTDLEMPRIHGYELIREVRYIPAFQALPIVVVSSRSAQKHQDQARSLGATDYITKPFSPEILDAAIKRWVTRG